MRGMVALRVLVAMALSVGLTACTERTTNLASSRPKLVDAAVPADSGKLPIDAASPPPADAAGDAHPPFVLSDAGIALCDGLPCACTNGLDDDDDGLVDGFDPECTAPFDRDEATFATGEPIKPGNQRCRDCFFDGTGSSGDDGCRIASSCSLDGTPNGGTGACFTCEPTAQCVNFCLPRTPNGCDCFGCCEVQTATGPIAVQLVDTCSLADLKNAQKCPRCTPSPDCRNECEDCELCPGRTIDELPSSCATPGGPGYSCENGEVCGPELPCKGAAYCSQGCCIPIVI